MAIWQFPIELVPEEWGARNRARIADYLGSEGWDLRDAWRGTSNSHEIEEVIDRHLERGKSWSDDLVIWGDAEKDDVHLYYENSAIEGVRIRIDLRGDFEQMIEKVVIVANNLNCSILVLEKSELISPSTDALKAFALSSRAAKDVAIFGKQLDDY